MDGTYLFNPVFENLESQQNFPIHLVTHMHVYRDSY
jgi:hypothetical protein